MRNLLKAAVLLAVAIDFLTPSTGVMQAHAQGATPLPGDAFPGQTRYSPPMEGAIVDPLSRKRLVVNQDGSINVTQATSYPPSVPATAGCAATVNTQYTLTLSPPAGQYVYLTALQLIATGNATGSSVTIGASTQWVTTNFGGWAWDFATTSAIMASNQLKVADDGYYPPVKSTKAGTAVTIVTPAAVTNNSYCIRAAYFFAP